jgi:hypothetical protein
LKPNGARKFDNEKAPVTTGVFWRFPRALMEIAKVSAVGAEKYEVVLPDNHCLQVDNGFNRYADADGRHLLLVAIEGKWNTEKGGALPEEGRKVRHLAQHAWDALTILEMELLAEEKATLSVEPLKSCSTACPTEKSQQELLPLILYPEERGS